MELNKKKYTVLYTDDEITGLEAFKSIFSRKFRVLIATSGAEALRIIETETVHLIISDQRMPNMTGVELLRKCKILVPKTLRVIVTGYSDLGTVIKGVNECGIFRYIPKPWNFAEMEEIIHEACRLYEEGKYQDGLVSESINAQEIERLNRVTEHSKEIIFETDKDGFFVYTNRQLKDYLSSFGDRPSIFDLLDEKDGGRLKSSMKKNINGMKINDLSLLLPLAGSLTLRCSGDIFLDTDRRNETVLSGFFIALP